MANCAPDSAAGGASQCESAKLKGLCAHADSWVRSRCTTTCCGIDATNTPPPAAAGLRLCHVDERASFAIHAKDAYGNAQPAGGEKFRVAIRRDGDGDGDEAMPDVTPSVLDQGDGVYTVEYTCASLGLYRVSVHHAAAHGGAELHEALKPEFELPPEAPPSNATSLLGALLKVRRRRHRSEMGRGGVP